METGIRFICSSNWIPKDIEVMQIWYISFVCLIGQWFTALTKYYSCALSSVHNYFYTWRELWIMYKYFIIFLPSQREQRRKKSKERYCLFTERLLKRVSITGHWFILVDCLLGLDIMSLLITGSDITINLSHLQGKLDFWVRLNNPYLIPCSYIFETVTMN